MKDSIRTKLENLTERLQELDALLAEPEIIADQNKFRSLSKEHAEIQPIVDCFQQYRNNLEAIAGAKEMLRDKDAEMRALAEEELAQAQAEEARLETELLELLLPKELGDNSNIFLEIRAGTGGDEAALFAGDLAKMYACYIEQRGWQMEPINKTAGEHGGYKEFIMRVSGPGAYSEFKFESGVHRVQRVPKTESQGRIHTSACTVAVMPEVLEVDDIKINPADLRVDTFRASGAGGQHVNKTDSAIRLTHLPTGIVVECQDERSQHKNRARANSLLKARLLQAERDRQQAEQAETRRNLVGSGDRSERIRTYNFPQGRVTDHRIGLTLYQLNEILAGNLNHLIEPLKREHKMDLLASMGE
ncbi:MAG: peptide chain release factor 1 [Candidatus Parabeggiatoa sp. nov. 2]|nr:MAG: peptide chain release factor 1 [Beggiatoa sp. 4572_84]RKZ46272.1 MAG: peptide chain release factor 1 [Gammaproteobacteria bacterium]HEC84772.1 peptide chain release factor 1 [Thioploca sp.]